MPRNEPLVFFILKIVRTLRAPFLEEQSLLNELKRMGKCEYSAELVHEHLQMMLQGGLLKAVTLAQDKVAYTMDWGGLDYLESN
jgi:hypothetical protein